ncbi:J domain-containing protein [Chamaesiphon sp. OTE_75_metabat_556]|uniref:J domain-containing protein n=1 Tax=Chamaesiphon sp. OTE_75_metabat_556 TaxID=2964692 RepID=UPI00286D663D|nr:J domain-containing protein [Chamaesiphon sp. OTE_75_metabat_556]
MLGSNITIKKSYALLGLKPSASVAEIKTIYRQMAKEIHPDLNPHDPTARDRFYTLNQAYQLLLSIRAITDRVDVDESTEADGRDLVDAVRVNYVVDPPLSPQDLQLKQEVFENLEKLIRQENFAKAVSVIDLLVRVVPDRPEIFKKQSEIYFKYAQDLVNRRTQLTLARKYLKASLKIDPHNQQRWQAVDRQFNRIERLAK